MADPLSPDKISGRFLANALCLLIMDVLIFIWQLIIRCMDLNTSRVGPDSRQGHQFNDHLIEQNVLFHKTKYLVGFYNDISI